MWSVNRVAYESRKEKAAERVWWGPLVQQLAPLPSVTARSVYPVAG